MSLRSEMNSYNLWFSSFCCILHMYLLNLKCKVFIESKFFYVNKNIYKLSTYIFINFMSMKIQEQLTGWSTGYVPVRHKSLARLLSSSSWVEPGYSRVWLLLISATSGWCVDRVHDVNLPTDDATCFLWSVFLVFGFDWHDALDLKPVCVHCLIPIRFDH
jgi:hypothetical protein